MEQPNDFAAAWQSTDATNLLPKHLHRATVQRAWDRKPQSPFSRRRFKVGKVWKRTNNTLSTSLFQSVDKVAVSPTRAVKKMCLESGFGVSAQVRNWESRESPNGRRIVTRSAKSEGTAGEDLQALSDSENNSFTDFDQGLTEVHLVKEDGTLERQHIEEIDGDGEWLDVKEEQEFDGSLMRLADAVTDPEKREIGPHESKAFAPALNVDDDVFNGKEATFETEIGVREMMNPIENIADPQSTTTPETGQGLLSERAKMLQSSQRDKEKSSTSWDNFSVPMGFVSPAFERHRRPIKQARLSNATRRRTLPVNFATFGLSHRNTTSSNNLIESGLAEASAKTASQLDSDAEVVVERDEDQKTDRSPTDAFLPDVAVESDIQEIQEEAIKLAGLDNRQLDSSAPTETARNEHFADVMVESDDDDDDDSEGEGKNDVDNEDEWEDVEEAVPEDGFTASTWTPENTESLNANEGNEDNNSNEPTSPLDAITSSNTGFDNFLAMPESPTSISKSPGKPAPSPVRSIARQHPRLPLRRSPRRQSSSPLKRNLSLQPMGKSHLIAFTPVKGLTQSHAQSSRSPFSPPTVVVSPTVTAGVGEDELKSLPERCSSAPPEEPHMSLQKPRQARISDDTALLQAFISRAAESKTSRRMSVTAERESNENRRDSDAVRQALASSETKPAPEVLTDLDPNSPAPRQPFATDDTDNIIDFKLQSPRDEDVSFESPTRKPTSRRSGRMKKKPETLPGTAYSAPNKIAIRGNTDSVVLKRTEAQELALLTRNNTRKNKGGSVLPPLRLTKIAGENGASCEESILDATLDGSDSITSRVTWADTLVSYFENSADPEVSLLSEDLTGSIQLAMEGHIGGDIVGIPSVAPGETPVKPRLRRLKPPRTSFTSMNTSTRTDAVTSVAESSTVATPAAPSTRPKTRRSKSRIATPAKPKGDSGTLGLEEDIEDDMSICKAAPSSSKKMPSSKLPAPATSSTTAMSSSLSSTAKENSLITSPPKKKSRPTRDSAHGNNTMPSSRTSASKLDFSKAGTMPGLRWQGEESDSIPGIASPAKKRRRSVLSSIGENTAMIRAQEKEEPGLGSPAKRRVRRTMQ